MPIPSPKCQIYPVAGETAIKNIVDGTLFTGTGTPTLVDEGAEKAWSIPTGTLLEQAIPAKTIDGNVAGGGAAIAIRFKTTANGSGTDFMAMIGAKTTAGNITDGFVFTRNGVNSYRGRVSASLPAVAPSKNNGVIHTLVYKLAITNPANDFGKIWWNTVGRVGTDPDAISGTGGVFGVLALAKAFINCQGGAAFTLLDFAWFDVEPTDADCAAIADNYRAVMPAPSGGTAPTGTVTIGTIVPNSTGASAPFTYSAADQTGFEYQLNETGTIYPIAASPATPTGLTPSTAYTIRVRAVNAAGAGTWSTSAPFTTSGVAVSFVGGPIPDQVATVGVFFSLNVAAYFAGTLNPRTYDFSFGNVTGTGLALDANTGMLEGTPTSSSDLDLQFRATDTGTNTAVSNLVALLINPASDVTPPTFTVPPAVSSITQTGGTATATINETGSIFYVIVPQAQATPSVAQVIAGQNASGAAPIDSGSAVGTTTLSDAFTGLTAGQAYKACFVARDDEPTPNVQASVTVVNFTAAAAPAGTITITGVVNNTDTPWASAAVDAATVMPPSLGSVVVNKTGLSVTVGADLVITDAAIVTGTEYIIILKIGTAYGWYRAVAT